MRRAGDIEGIEGVELCYPADFDDPQELRKLLDGSGLGIAAVNVRSRRSNKWLRGSFSSSIAAEREDVVDSFKKAIDLSVELGCYRITTCPLNDGHDYVFEMNYLDAYAYAEETFRRICTHNDRVRICIEYKTADPRAHCLFPSAGETASFCQTANIPNLGITFDVGHSLMSGERPAQAASVIHRARRLFYVHLNDNDRTWDWDMAPGAYNLWDFVELFFYLAELGYTDDWYTFDVMSKELDPERVLKLAADMTRRMEGLAGRIERKQMLSLMSQRNPVESLEYLWRAVLQ
jgi:xylose isomerase